MTTSIVIPVYNGLEYLQKNLKSVVALGADEVIVVDDASTDASASFIKENFPSIKLITHRNNTRFPISVNDGFAAATGEIVFLFNQDVLPSKNLLKNTLVHFSDSSVFAVTFNEGKRSWAKAEFKNGFLEFTNGPIDDKIHESFWASGGSAAFRKDVWQKLGGFDPIFTPGYYEDLDLGWRAGRSGYKIIWDPKCAVTHETETSINKVFSADKLQKIKERNYLLAHWKNLTAQQWPSHINNLFLRLLKHPGYVIPVSMALWQRLVS